MRRFEILEHKADLKIRAFGKTKEDLFRNALLGMEKSMKPEVRQPEEKTSREIRITSLDLLALLVDFLSEALYLSQVNREVYFDAEFEKFSDKEIEGELSGQKVGIFGEDIKAVTHHDLNLHQRKDGLWEATVLFDI